MAKEVFSGITVDPQVVHGRPVIAGTRVPVEVVTGELADGSSFRGDHARLPPDQRADSRRAWLCDVDTWLHDGICRKLAMRWCGAFS